MNKVILMGRLTRDVEIRYSEGSGKAVARFDLAVNRRYKQEGQPEADFFSCVAFGKMAETFEKCEIGKGTKLMLEGEIRNNNYEKDGVKHYSNQVIANSFEFCESKGSGSRPAPVQQAASDGFMNIPDNIGEELPFS